MMERMPAGLWWGLQPYLRGNSGRYTRVTCTHHPHHASSITKRAQLRPPGSWCGKGVSWHDEEARTTGASAPSCPLIQLAMAES